MAHALQMTVVPLVVALVIVGVNTASDAAAASGRIAQRAIIVFIVLLGAGAAFAVVAGPLLLSWPPRDPALVDSLRAATGAPTAQAATPNLSDWFSAIVPSNAIAAAAQSAMLPPGSNVRFGPVDCHFVSEPLRVPK